MELRVQPEKYQKQCGGDVTRVVANEGSNAMGSMQRNLVLYLRLDTIRPSQVLQLRTQSTETHALGQIRVPVSARRSFKAG